MTAKAERTEVSPITGEKEQTTKHFLRNGGGCITITTKEHAALHGQTAERQQLQADVEEFLKTFWLQDEGKLGGRHACTMPTDASNAENPKIRFHAITVEDMAKRIMARFDRYMYIDSRK